MKILITNNAIADRSGSELYVKELAEKLAGRGHIVAAYSTQVGELGDQMVGIQVVDDLSQIKWTPDIIHGQHHLEAMTALAHFPDVPAVYFCHGWRPWQEASPTHPRIVEYAAVDLLTMQHAMEDQKIPANKIRLVHNFVDLERFKKRPPLPEKPRKALVFSNYANDNNYLSLVREACSRANIDLEVVGYSSGNQTKHPEDILGNYDLVFAVGRSAFEALATGAAVVICGFWGVGPMVSLGNMEKMYDLNFGTAAMYSKPDADAIYQEICKYDAKNSEELTGRIRDIVDIESVVDEIEKIYVEALNKYKNIKIDSKEEALAFSNYLRDIAISLKKKYSESEGANQLVWQKNKEINSLNQSLQELDQSVRQKKAEIFSMKSSKFWKLREMYLKVKNIIFS